jgi:putative transposase
MDKPHDKTFPQRKTLPHNPPPGIDISRETFFITVCLADRFPEKPLTKADIAFPLIDTVVRRNENHTWWCSTFIVMPDHVHGLFRFPSDAERNCSMQKTMGNWKSWTARSLGIKWQRGWFDHRLRNHEKECETAEYIRNNPVRSGLAKTADDWPYHFVAEG